MIHQCRPSLRLLSLNVNGLRSASKRRSLFTFLQRDRWDVILLQKTHHADDAEGQAWAEEGPHGLTANWSGPSFWSHGSAASRGVALLFRAGAHIADISIRHQSADGRILSADFTFVGGAFTVASIYAPCTAAARAAFFIQHLLPSLQAQRQLLLGGDFNCIADLGSCRCPSAAVHTPLSTVLQPKQIKTVLQPVRPTMHPSSLAPHDMIIATLQDRSAWRGFVAPCFPH